MKINSQRMIAAGGLLALCGIAAVSCTSAEVGQTINIFRQGVKIVCPNDPDMDRLVDGLLILSAVVCAVWEESEVEERAAYATSGQYVEANQKQLNTRLKQAKKANKELSRVTSQKGKVDKQKKEEAKKAIDKNVKLIDQDIRTAQKATKEASGAELESLRQQINALSEEKRQLQTNKNKLSALSSI